MVVRVLDKVGDIRRSKFSVQSLFHIFDFSGNNLIIVVKSGVFDELLVEHTFQEEVEIRHESGIVTILVLSKDRSESDVSFFIIWVSNELLGESEYSLGKTESGNTNDETKGSQSRVMLAHFSEDSIWVGVNLGISKLDVIEIKPKIVSSV